MKIVFLHISITILLHEICSTACFKVEDKKNTASIHEVRRVQIPYYILPSDLPDLKSPDHIDRMKSKEHCRSKKLLDITLQDKTINEEEDSDCAEEMKYIQLEGCPKYEIPPDQNCMEMGCTVGEQCTVPKLKNRKCCPHKINDIQVTCCLAKPILPEKLSLSQSTGPPCPPADIPLKHHCMQIGCAEGSLCMNKGIEHLFCCRHTYKGSPINCCLAQPEVVQSVSYCPEYKTKEKFDCMEIGCELDSTCQHQSFPGQRCCQYLIKNNVVNCCLMKRKPKHEKSKPLIGCPANQTIPARHQCLDIGCKVGSLCTSAEGEGIMCCPFRKNDTDISCCLKKKRRRSAERTKFIEKNLKKCPALNIISAKSACMEIGCEEGTECTAAGVEGQPCCPYLLKRFRISCCLPRTDKKASKPNAYPLSSHSIKGKCPTVDIPEGFNCMEIGCKEGDRCSTSGLRSQYCCKHQVNFVPVTCCLTLPRPKGCNYIKVVPNQFNCMEIGCQEGVSCTSEEVRGQICCPYVTNGYHISCCLVTHDHGFTRRM